MIPIRWAEPTYSLVEQQSARDPDMAEIAGSSLAETTAEWTGVWFQRGLISRMTPVRIRPPQLKLSAISYQLSAVDDCRLHVWLIGDR